MQTLTRPQTSKATSLNIRTSSPLITAVMNDMVMIYHYQKMTDATDELIQAKSTCGVVVDGIHKCVGVLTQTDVRNYFQLWIRYLDHDETVMPEIFKTNAYGALRIDREYFHQVGKHMTSPVVAIPSTARCVDAMDLFDQNQGIHHLVVVDENSKPIGVVSQNNLPIPTFDSPEYQLPTFA